MSLGDEFRKILGNLATLLQLWGENMSSKKFDFRSSITNIYKNSWSFLEGGRKWYEYGRHTRLYKKHSFIP